jgi:monoamine oxidase
MRVVVVGAGFAGLAAADALHRAGHDVVVMEARDRVGGRVHSRRLDNGAVIEMGAEFILPGYQVMWSMLVRFGLDTWSKGMRYGNREPRGGIGVDRVTLREAAAVIAAALTARPKDAAAMTAAQLLASLDLDPGAEEAITARVEVSAANSADVVVAEELGLLAAQFDEPCPSVAGGNQRLAEALASELGDRVHLRTPVKRVAWTATEVRVAAGAEIAADACVVSAPAAALGRISFDPPMDPALSEAFGRITYGHAAKLFVPLASIPMPSAVLSVPERYWTWTATGDRDQVQPVVSSFAGSKAALSTLRVEEGTGTWTDSMRRLRPDLSLDESGAVLSTWSDDPWAHAAYSTLTPDSPNVEELCRPMGRVFFCGEHTEGRYAALMEGALRSGLRAAEQVRAIGAAG